MANVNVAIRITSNYRGGPGFKKADRDVKKFRKNVGRAANSVRAFQFVLAGVTISTLSIWGKKLIDVSGELQLLQIRLNNVEGSAKAGSKQFQTLFQKFKTAPFEIDKVIDGFVRLRAAGISTGLATETMENLVDAVAAFGGTTQELQRATIGFQQVAGKGVLSMEELRQQIGEAVPAAMVLMSRSAGVTVGQFVEQVKDGMISAGDAIRFFNEGAKEAFGGFADNLKFTIVGALQGLKSEVRLGIHDLFNVRTDASARIAAFIKVLTDRISTFIQSLDQKSINDFWTSFEGIAALIEGVVKAITGLVFAIGKLLGLAGQAVGVLGGQVLVAGIIGTMLFGRGPGVIVAGIVAIIGALGGFEFIANRIANFKTPLDMGDPDVKKAMDLMRASGAKVGQKSLRAFMEGEGVPTREGGLAFHPRPPGVPETKAISNEFEELVKKYRQASNEMDFKGVLAGILGLGAGVADLTEDLIRLSDKSGRAADNFGVPWISTLNEMQKASEKLESQISPLKEKLDEEFRTRGKAIREDESLTIEQQAEALTRLSKRYDEAALEGAGLQARVDGINKNLEKFKSINAEKSYRDMSVAIQEMSLRALEATGGMNEFEVEIEQSNIKSASFIKKLDDLIVKLTALAKLDEREKALLAAAIALREKEGAVRAANADKIRVAQEFRLKSLRLETDILRANTAEEIRRLKRENDFGVKNLINSELQNEVLSRKAALQSQVLDIQKEILRIEGDLTLLILHPDVRAELEKQLELWRLKKRKIEEVAATISEEALLEQKLWQDLGQIMENGVGNAIEGLITGTKTLKQAMLDMWKSAIRAASEYIVKLLFMKALGALGGGGGNFLSGFTTGGLFDTGSPFAKGGVFQGNVKPFANGDIIRGPTMFGLAGEAGTEAIMPLARGPGGKLGVRSQGGGGDTYNVNIQAIDTQTGADFLMNNMETIIQGFTHESTLNRGVRRGVS